jgi:hypothetical protein
VLLARYAAFRLCREMGWTLQEYRAQPAAWVRQCLTFLAAEQDAAERSRRLAEERVRAGMRP